MVLPKKNQRKTLKISNRNKRELSEEDVEEQEMIEVENHILVMEANMIESPITRRKQNTKKMLRVRRMKAIKRNKTRKRMKKIKSWTKTHSTTSITTVQDPSMKEWRLLLRQKSQQPSLKSRERSYLKIKNSKETWLILIIKFITWDRRL